MSVREGVAELLARALPAEIVGRFAARDGVPDCPLAAPRTPEEAAAVVDVARGERWTVLPLGAGSKLGWAAPPVRVDLVLSSRNLRGITAYEPADGTLTARAGTSWSELADATRARHHLSPELPLGAPATLGGVLGASASGLDRLRHGPLRHQVLGIQALHADGSFVKSGGRVVKNVTGYDLHRLWCGSHGTLCFLLEATLRLHAAPAEVATLHARCASLAEALALSHALWRSRIQPVAVVLRAGAASDAELDIVLAGRAEAVASELATAQALVPGAETARGDDGAARRAALRELELADGGWPPLVLACRPSKLADALARLERAAGALGLTPRILCHPLLASAAVSFPGTELGERHVAALEQGLADPELALRWRGPPGRTLPPPPAAAAALMRRLKESLDPAGVFVAGRLHDGA